LNASELLAEVRYVHVYIVKDTQQLAKIDGLMVLASTIRRQVLVWITRQGMSRG